MEHNCIYLIGEDGKILHCWQKGKKIAESKCTRCLLAYLVGSQYASPKARHPALRPPKKGES